ncbi:MAG: site-specific integrase [Saprospiraceae bacterium]
MKKIRFNLYTYPNGKDGLILLRFNFKAQRYQITTGLAIPLKYWNDASQRAKEVKDFPEAKSLNAQLDRMARDTKALFDGYGERGVIPTQQQFKEDWLKMFRPEKVEAQEAEEKALGLFEFIELLIQERRGMNRPGSSLLVYGNCKNNLEAYQKAKGQPLTFEGLNSAFVADFVAWLFSQGFSDAYTHKIISTLKMFVRAADERGIYSGSPLLKVKIPVSKRSKDTVYLNERELEHLFSLELEGRLANVRDLFLIGAYSGLRFSDFSQVKAENIQPIESKGKTVECLVITTQKTKQKVVLPLTNPILRAVLERHGWKAPRAISNQKLNNYLKELAQLAGFTQEVEISEYKAGRQMKKAVPKWELISSHTARRSFCTNAYKRGVPVPDIMRFSGHTSVQTFMKYIRAGQEETAVELAEHAFFTGKAPLKVAK